MERVRTIELPQLAGTRVLLRGWLHHRRELANVTFLILRDGTGTAQIALSPTEGAAVSHLPAESAIEVVGYAFEDTRAPGGVEIRNATIRVLAAARDLHRVTP